MKTKKVSHLNFGFQTEVASDVISSTSVEKIGPEELVKFGDSRSNKPFWSYATPSLRDGQTTTSTHNGVRTLRRKAEHSASFSLKIIQMLLLSALAISVYFMLNKRDECTV